MLALRCLVISVSLYVASTAQAQVISLEGGVDAFRQNFETVDQGVSFASRVGPTAAVSVYLQVSDLRSYYGLYLTGHTGNSEPKFVDSDVIAPDNPSQSQWATMLGWRAFLFDLEGDCDCPSWKEENWLRKATFFELALGYGQQSWEVPDAVVDGGRTRGGAAYLARVGLAHRLTQTVDAFAAIGFHGLVGEEVGYGNHHAAARATVGISYRL